jgi:hypothetical protein
MDKFSKGKPGGASKTKNSKFILSINNNNKTTTITKPNKTGCPRILIAYTIYKNLVKTQL